MNRKLGRITPQSVPRLKFGDYVEPGTSAAELPREVYRPDRGFAWKILANGPDPTVTVNANVARFGVGNCVIARTFHAIQHEYISGGKTPPAFTGDEGVALYSKVTGFDPSQTNEQGENPTDRGTDPSVMDNYWRTTGVPLPGGGVDKLAAHLEVDKANAFEWSRAIWEFDGLGVGLELTQSAEEAHTWAVIPGDPVIGGHEIFAFSYDPSGFGIDSWGELLRMTPGYLHSQCDQLTVYLSEDQIKKTGISDTGFNYTRLQQDFERLM